MTFTRLDDGGVMVSGTPTTKWIGIESYLVLSDVGLSAGDVLSLSCDGWAKDRCELSVAYRDANNASMGVSVEPGGFMTVPDGAVRVRATMSSGTITGPIDFTARPMLTRSAAPVDYFVPYVVGGGVV